MDFFPTYYYFIILICTYLNDLKFNIYFFFASKFNVMYLFKLLISVPKAMKSDEDATKHGKIV
jgi:hypothetical protein